MGRQRGSIRSRGENKWLVRVYIGTGQDGRRKYTSATVYGSKKDAQERLTEMLYELDTGQFVQPSATTVQSYVEAWIEGKDVRKTTRLDYHSRMKNDIYPRFGSTPLQDLQPHQLRAHFRALGEPPRNLSKRTRQYSHMIFKQALKQAKQDGLVRTNPMENVDRPSVQRQDKVQKIQPFTKAEVQRFLKASEGSWYHPLWVLLLSTGLRPSEALALTWENVDLEGGSLRVIQGLSRVGRGEYEIGGLKTASSERRVSLPPTTIEALKAHRARQGRTLLKLGARTVGLVFPNKSGKPLDLSRLRRRWKKTCKTAEVPVIRLYDARHTHATRLLDAGVNPKAAAERLGHSSTKMFLDVYTHVTEDQREQLGEAVEAAMFGT